VSENAKRLEKCFLSVFPDIDQAAIPQATPDSVAGWDSVATVTLLAVIEEEFGIMMDIDDLAKIESFEGILSQVNKATNSEMSDVK
jgi:acyl carrier protein